MKTVPVSRVALAPGLFTTGFRELTPPGLTDWILLRDSVVVSSVRADVTSHAVWPLQGGLD